MFPYFISLLVAISFFAIGTSFATWVGRHKLYAQAHVFMASFKYLHLNIFSKILFVER